jgi:subtilase family serine protease
MKNQNMTTKINTMKSIFTLLIVLLFTSLSQAQTELLINPNFTSENYGWTVTQDFKYNTQFSTYNFDPGYAYLPQTDHAYGVLDQVVNIPSNTTSCTFSFYYKITSDEVTTTTAFDKCLVQIMDNSGNRYEFVTLSNLNESSGYQYVGFNIPSSFFGKQVTIRFIGDNDGAKPTIFRIDNCSMKATQTVVNKPDLTVTSSFSTPGSITTDGNTILLNVNFKNQGTGNSPAFAVKYFLSETSAYNSATAVLLATQSYNALSAGSSSAASIYLTIPSGLSAGTKYILSYVDPSNSIDESNENNNIGAAALSVTSTPVNKPDLTVTSSFSTPSSITTDGNTILLNVNFKNQGTGNSPAFAVKYFLSETSAYNSATAVLLATQSYNALSAGSSSAASIYLTIPSGLSAGTKYILSYVDPSNSIDESNENNNIGAAPITITPATINKPDLTVTSSFSTPGTIVNSGGMQVLLVNTNVKNIGNASSENYKINYFLSPTQVYNASTAIDLSYGVYSGLAASSSRAISTYLSIYSGLVTGTTMYILQYVDFDNASIESNEDNNIGAASIVITGPAATKPDLIITNFTGPATSTPLGSISVNCTIQNLGGTTANNFVVSFHLSDDAVVNAGDLYLGEYAISSLSTNQYNSFYTVINHSI